MLWIVYKKYHLVKAVYSPRLMSEAATKEGIENEVYYSEFFSVVLENGVESLYYQNKKIECLPKVAFIRCYNFQLMSFLEKNGVELVNSFEGMKLVKNKYDTHYMAAKLNISQPETILPDCVDFDFLKSKLSLPFVMKDNLGAAGRNVYLVSTKEQMEEILEQNKGVSFIFQKYVAFSKGKDIRLYVVGDEVVGCITRIATSEDFRANISLGARAEKFECGEELKVQAVKLAKSLGLRICSVDYLFSGDDFMFCEANGNAAFHAFFSVGYNMQELFMKYIKRAFFS